MKLLEKLPSIIDKDLQIRNEYIKAQSWASIIVLGPFRVIEAYWLSQAVSLNESSDRATNLICFNEGVETKITTIGSSYREILDSVSVSYIDPLIITDNDFSYLAYFSMYGDFYMICGGSEFLSVAYPLPFSVVEADFFDEAKFKSERDHINVSYYKKLWKRYNV
ncbi:MAG: hypothetical protein AAFX09_08930 [Pseudomonadota bacterium]